MTADKLELVERRKEVVRRWQDYGLPNSVATVVARRRTRIGRDLWLDRCERQVEWCDQRAGSVEGRKQVEMLVKAWSLIDRTPAPASAIDRSPAVSILLTMPDTDDLEWAVQEADRLRGDGVRIKARRAYYSRLAGHARGLAELLERPFDTPDCPRRNLERDALATQAGRVRHADFVDHHEKAVKAGLASLIDLLQTTDPADRMVSPHHGKPEEAHRIAYVRKVASLNRHLSIARHAQLARIGMANLVKYTLTRDAIRRAWEEIADQFR